MTKAPNKPVTSSSFAAMKRQKEKIAMLTAYDYSMARCVAASLRWCLGASRAAVP